MSEEERQGGERSRYIRRERVRTVRYPVPHLKAWRQHRGWSIRQLGALSDVHHTSITEIENGRREANGKTIDKLAHALRITRKKLLNEEPPTQAGGEQHGD